MARDNFYCGIERRSCTLVGLLMKELVPFLRLSRGCCPLVQLFGKKSTVTMGEFKHFVIVKFKEGVAVEELTKGMEKLVSEIDAVKSFEWGKDIESLDVLRQGFTHAFLMTFNKKEDFTAFQSHPNHIEFSATFSEAIEKIVLLDFPSTLVKAPA